MRARATYWQWGLLPVLVAPWLTPPQGGPSPSLVPILISSAGMGLALCCVPWLVARGTSRAEIAELVAGAWLTAAVISSIIGVFQYFGAAHFYLFMSPADPGEAYGNLRQRNQFATLTNLGLMAVIWWSAQARIRQSDRWPSWPLSVVVMLLAIGNAASLSRTGLIQILLVASIVVFSRERDVRERRLIITAMLTYALAAWILPILQGHEPGAGNVLSRFKLIDDPCTSRFTLWSNVWSLIELRPWLGWGWGELDYSHFMTVYDGNRFCDNLDNAHNLPLHIAVELGLPFAVLISSLLAGLIWRAKPWCEIDTNRQLAWRVLALICLHSMLEYPLWYGPFQMAMALSVGILLWPKDESNQQKVGDNRRQRLKYWMTIVGVSLLISSVYAAWDYYRVSQIFYPPSHRAAAYRDNTLEKIRGTWLFQDQVQFAEFVLTPLTPETASHLYGMGQRLLHYSPEARVVEKLIECALVLKQDAAANYYLARYRAAFPREHARWAEKRLAPRKAPQ